MSNENVKLSIVVPVYNVEDYLEQCLHSILEQTYENWELIIVDDGSTDNSISICEKIAGNDGRITIIRQTNQGVAKARKNGVMIAQGEYIAFVDADDYLSMDYFDNMIMASSNCDVVTSGYYKCYKEEVPYFDHISAGIYSEDKELQYVFNNMIITEQERERGITPYIWNKLFRRVIAQQVFGEIDENIYFAEDSEFLYKFILKCKTVCVTSLCGYFYRIRDNSVVNSSNPMFLLNIHRLYTSLRTAFENHNDAKRLLEELEIWLSGLIVLAPNYMGFCEAARTSKYIYSLQSETEGCNIVLYGAGLVGQDYRRQIKNNGLCNIALWVDEKWDSLAEKGMEIQSPALINNSDFDYVIVAVLREQLAIQIREHLELSGIAKEKILWKKPILL